METPAAAIRVAERIPAADTPAAGTTKKILSHATLRTTAPDIRPRRASATSVNEEPADLKGSFAEKQMPSQSVSSAGAEKRHVKPESSRVAGLADDMRLADTEHLGLHATEHQGGDLMRKLGSLVVLVLLVGAPIAALPNPSKDGGNF
jgi:hypothetical protein